MRLDAEPVYVYRTYNDRGRLLYVGQASDPVKRLWAHRYTAPWYLDFSALWLEVHDSLDEARAAEKEAIKTEWPLWNGTSSPDATVIRPARKPSRPKRPLYGAAAEAHEDCRQREIRARLRHAILVREFVHEVVIYAWWMHGMDPVKAAQDWIEEGFLIPAPGGWKVTRRSDLPGLKTLKPALAEDAA